MRKFKNKLLLTHNFSRSLTQVPGESSWDRSSLALAFNTSDMTFLWLLYMAEREISPATEKETSQLH